MATNPPSSSTEILLIEAWRAGDRHAGNRLCADHHARVRRFFSARVRSPDDVEELVQQTYARCVEALPRFRGDAKFGTWLLAIAHNVLREWQRARQCEQEFEDVEAAPTLDLGAVELLVRAEEGRLLRAGLRRLTYDSRRVLELHGWEQLDSGEIAAILDIPRGTARSRLRRARLELRGVIDELVRTRVAFCDHDEA